MRALALLCALPVLAGCGAAVVAPSVHPAQHTVVKRAPESARVAKVASPEPDRVALLAWPGSIKGEPASIARLPFNIDPPDDKTAAAENERLRSGALQKWNWVPPGQEARWGHAEILVQAPIEAVRAQITDYAHLSDLAPTKFKTSRIVDKRPGTTDVYVQIPLLHGLVTLWQVMRFAPPQVLGPGFEIVQAGLVKGNVKQMNLIVTMRSIDASRTVLMCDLSIELDFVAPQAAIDEELRDAAGDAVSAVKTRAEAQRVVVVAGNPRTG